MPYPSSRPANGPSGSPRERPEVLARRRRNHLEGNLATVPMRQAHFLAENPEKARELVRMRTMSAPQRMEHISDVYGQRINEALPRIREGLKDVHRASRGASNNRTEQTPLDRINAVAKGLMNPPGGSAAKGTHRYLTGYDLNYGQVEGDQQYLQAIANTRPDLAPDLMLIHRGLEDLMRQDPRYGIRQFEKRHEEDNVDKKVYKALQGGLFVAAAFASVITLAMSLGQRKLSSVPFFYAGIALLAYPGVWDQLFSGKDKLMVQEVSGALNDPNFKSICKKYHVQGRGWANHARMMMKSPAPTKSLMSALKRNNLHSKGNPALEKEVEKYVRAMPGSAEDKQKLQEMIDEEQFVDFARPLLTLQNEDAKIIAYDYINMRAGM